MTLTPIRYGAYGYPMAEQVDGRWVIPAPDSLQQDTWGTFRIEAGATWNVAGTATKTAAGTDVTTVNGVPTLVTSLPTVSP